VLILEFLLLQNEVDLAQYRHLIFDVYRLPNLQIQLSPLQLPRQKSVADHLFPAASRKKRRILIE
jgi:hypothetical protein